MASRRLARALKRAGVTEHGLGPSGDLLSEPVLLVDGAIRNPLRRGGSFRQVSVVYDRQGNLRATVNAACDSSFIKTVVSSGPMNHVIVDVRNQTLLKLKIAGGTYTALTTDGTEVASVTLPPPAPGSGLLHKPDYPIQAAGQTCGYVRWAAWGPGRSATQTTPRWHA